MGKTIPSLKWGRKSHVNSSEKQRSDRIVNISCSDLIVGWNVSPWKSMKWWKSHIFACKSMILGDCGDDQDFMPLFFISVIFCHPTPIESKMEWTPISVLVPIIPIMIKTGYFIPLIIFFYGQWKKILQKFHTPLFFHFIRHSGKSHWKFRTP